MGDSPRITELRRRIQQDPASVLFAQLAEELRRLGALDEAIAVCRTGLRHHPEYIAARVTLGRAFRDSGEVDAARRELEAVLQIAPDNVAARRTLADLEPSPISGTSPLPAIVVDAPGPVPSPIESSARPALDPLFEAPIIAPPQIVHLTADDRITRELEEWLRAIRADRAARLGPDSLEASVSPGVGGGR